MHVRRHQAKGVQLPFVTVGVQSQQGEERVSILIVDNDRRARYSARDHMVEATGDQKPRGTRHAIDGRADAASVEVAIAATSGV
jgi:hypothetical protein